MENVGEFIVNHWILVSAFVILAWLVFSDSINRRLSGLQPLGATQAVRLVNQNKGKFVDVRDPSEYEKEHIADSLNLPLSQLAEESKQLKDKTQPVVIVCASGQRARSAAKQLRGKGFEQVYVLTGGLHAWKEAKLPLFN
ncbi:rhodanese-like domain-containing protein [Methylophaga thiooxydans]|uniref:Rhodanese-like domain protein n=1 Tax=Methylophaga thiooxydans DMS010 TaxID=637616 RepID=C0N588_9GAMM|nr:rhodanese-like domain-containing protein [Methylophaga thiooxydans]EEF79851.1 rhodanese-like domain protein [Methylophaga thiooxydans DMS010]